MKIEIITVYMQRYKNGHEADFVPPITGIYLAALTPAKYEVKVLHQQVAEIDIDTTADLIALSFFSGFAPEAYSLARKFKDKGKIIIAGGPHVTYYSDEALNYFDAIIIGEAENVWEELLSDAEQGTLKKIYAGQTPTLETAPTPRYDLLPDAFFLKKVVQATRGCLFNCSFCTVPTLNPGFRKRPVEAVLQDIQYDRFSYWWQNKVVWFWDDNLTADRQYAKELLRKMIPLNKWWLTQASIDIVNDEELLDLMKASGCIGVFIGIETFDGDSLSDANKQHNKIDNYKNAVAALHNRGISVMAGLISGFDHDTTDSILKMVYYLNETDIDVPFMSILTPFKGTALYEKLDAEHRIISQRGLEFYNGYNVAFIPNKMTPEELSLAHRRLWSKAFSMKNSATRILRGLFKLRLGAILLSLFMNGFYGLKNLRGNRPIDMSIR